MLCSDPNRLEACYTFIGLALAGCSDWVPDFNLNHENVCSGDTIYSNDLKGEWYWLETGGGLNLITYTPSSTGRPESLIISEDTIFYFINNVLDEKKPYKLIIDIPACENDSMEFIQFDTTSWTEQQFSILHNRLVIKYICIADGGSKLYCRK